jgi:hypothetical protein
VCEVPVKIPKSKNCYGTDIFYFLKKGFLSFDKLIAEPCCTNTKNEGTDDIG